jgi:hypothetical protein
MPRFFHITIFLLSVLYSSAQPVLVPQMIRHLLSHPEKGIPIIEGTAKGLIPKYLLPPKISDEPEYLVKTAKGLFAGVSGTGRLYQIGLEQDSLVFRRVDSTYFEGYDFMPIVFTLSDTIYSYGGYGFWKNNGHLRFYDPINNDWNIVPIDWEVPATSAFAFYWFDGLNGELYIGHGRSLNNGLIGTGDPGTNLDDTLWVLNIHDRKWRKLGTLTKDLTHGRNTHWGIHITDDPSRFNILDLRNNRRLIASEVAILRTQSWLLKWQPQFWYSMDSTVYFGDVQRDLFDSLQLSGADLKPTQDKVYDEWIGGKSEWMADWRNILLALAIPVIAGLIFLVVRKPKKMSPPDINLEVTDDDYDDTGKDEQEIQTVDLIEPIQGKRMAEVFNNTELVLIRFLLDRSQEEATTSIDEINRILGLSTKNESIQKRNRNVVLTTINQKWALIHGRDEKLIDRKRSDYDGRNFEYFIPSSVIDTATGYFI